VKHTCAAQPCRPQSPRAARSVRLLFCLVSACLPCAQVYAQTPTPIDDEVVSVRTDLFTVPVVVTDAHGRRVGDLAAADFQARIDGQPAAIDFFNVGMPRVALLFALDASGSVAANVTRQRETALALCARFQFNSSVAVLAFDEQPRLLLPFTRAVEQARAAFEVRAAPNHHTAIFDAALAAVRAFDNAGLDKIERRIVVLVSDGLDTASTVRPTDVIAAADASGVTFYVIHLPLFAPAGDALAVRRPARGFRELGERTGGKYFLVGDERAAYDTHAAVNLEPVYQAIAADLLSQYVLGLYPPTAARTPGQHRVDISLNANAGRKLRVRQLREGYKIGK
jgi:Ca-activated chloride channel family protein